MREDEQFDAEAGLLNCPADRYGLKVVYLRIVGSRWSPPSRLTFGAG